MRFNSKGVIILFAWFALLWFGLRYWQLNRGSTLDKFREDARSHTSQKSMIKYVSKKTSLQYLDENGFDIPNKLVTPTFPFSISYLIIDKVRRNSDGSVKDFHKVSDESIITGYLYTLKYYMIAAWKSPTFTGDIMPYLLFIVAIASPFINKLIY